MAAPFVSGVAALVLAADPTLTPNEVRVRTLDLPPYPKETGMGDVPIQVTIVDRQIAARDAQGEMQPDTGATANEPPGGPQDNIRENERELAEVFAFMKEEWGDEIVIRMNLDDGKAVSVLSAF